MARADIGHGQGVNVDLDTIARLLVPLGMGVLTWLVVLLAGGALFSRNVLAPMTIFVLVIVGVLFVPIYRFKPWNNGLTDRLLDAVKRRHVTVTMAVGLVLLVRLPVVSDLLAPVLRLLMFPLRAVPQFLYGVRLFYGAHFADIAGDLLFAFGRLYLEFLWFYVVAAAIAILLPDGVE